MDYEKIDQAVADYEEGVCNGAQLVASLKEAGIPDTLLELIGNMHDRAVPGRPKRKPRCRECNGNGWTTDGWKSYPCEECRP